MNHFASCVYTDQSSVNPVVYIKKYVGTTTHISCPNHKKLQA